MPSSPAWLAAVMPPRRRRVSDMRETIASHASGDTLSVQFNGPIFGCYTVVGPVHRSASTGELTLGLALVTAAGSKPAKAVTAIRPASLWLDPNAVYLCTHPRAGQIVAARIRSFSEELLVVGSAVSQRRWPLSLAVGHHILRGKDGHEPDSVISVDSLSHADSKHDRTVSTPYTWSDLDDVPPDLRI